MSVRIWSVYHHDRRLVLALSDQPGQYNFAHLPPEDVDPVECPFATVQCYDTEGESDVLKALIRSRDVEEFIEKLENLGYLVEQGRPKSHKQPFL
jgi:hypothetical protein